MRFTRRAWLSLAGLGTLMYVKSRRDVQPRPRIWPRSPLRTDTPTSFASTRRRDFIVPLPQWIGVR